MIHCPSPNCTKVKLCNLSKHIDKVHPSLAVELYCPVCEKEVNIANVAKHSCFLINNQPVPVKRKRVRVRYPIRKLVGGSTFGVLDGLSLFPDIVSFKECLRLLKVFVRTRFDPIVGSGGEEVVTECSIVYRSYQQDILKQGGTKVLSLTIFLFQVNYMAAKYWNVDVGPFRKKEGKEEERVDVGSYVWWDETGSSTNTGNYFKVALK